MVIFVIFCDILQLPHTVISNSEKFTHPNICSTCDVGQLQKPEQCFKQLLTFIIIYCYFFIGSNRFKGKTTTTTTKIASFFLAMEIMRFFRTPSVTNTSLGCHPTKGVSSTSSLADMILSTQIS